MENKVKKPRAKSVEPIASVSPLSPQDKRILNDVKNNRPMDRICAQYMVHKEYVEKLRDENL